MEGSVLWWDISLQSRHCLPKQMSSPGVVALLFKKVRGGWGSRSGIPARSGRPLAETFKEHVSMTSVYPQRVRFRNCLAIQSGTQL